MKQKVSKLLILSLLVSMIYGTGVSATVTTPNIKWELNMDYVTNNVYNSIEGIDYLNGQFIKWGRLGTVSYSTDGISWTESTFDDTSNLVNHSIYNIGYDENKNQYVTMSAGFYATSTDGATWQTGDLGNRPALNDFVIGNNTYVGYDANALYYSADGDTFSEISVEMGDYEEFSNLLFIDNTFYVLLSSYQTSKILKSTDGQQWTIAYLDDEIYVSKLTNVNNECYILAYAEGEPSILKLASDNTVTTMPYSGLDDEQTSYYFDFSDMTYYNGEYYLLMYIDGSYCIYTADSTFNFSLAHEFSEYLSKIEVINNQLYAYASNTLYACQNGQWNEINKEQNMISYASTIFKMDDIYYLAGNGAMYSTDLENWTSITDVQASKVCVEGDYIFFCNYDELARFDTKTKEVITCESIYDEELWENYFLVGEKKYTYTWSGLKDSDNEIIPSVKSQAISQEVKLASGGTKVYLLKYIGDNIDLSANLDQNTKAAILNQLGIIIGDGVDYNLDGTLTRAEAVVFLARISGNGWVGRSSYYARVGAEQFSDVNEADWFASYVGYGVDYELLNGYDDGTFRPNDPLNEQAFLKMLLVTLGYTYGEDFEWDNTYDKAIELNIITEKDTSANYVRGNVIDLLYNSLTFKCENFGGSRLIDTSLYYDMPEEVQFWFPKE